MDTQKIASLEPFVKEAIKEELPHEEVDNAARIDIAFAARTSRLKPAAWLAAICTSEVYFRDAPSVL